MMSAKILEPLQCFLKDDVSFGQIPKYAVSSGDPDPVCLVDGVAKVVCKSVSDTYMVPVSSIVPTNEHAIQVLRMASLDFIPLHQINTTFDDRDLPLAGFVCYDDLTFAITDPEFFSRFVCYDDLYGLTVYNRKGVIRIAPNPSIDELVIMGILIE